jgi:hypothetical protein
VKQAVTVHVIYKHGQLVAKLCLHLWSGFRPPRTNPLPGPISGSSTCSHAHSLPSGRRRPAALEADGQQKKSAGVDHAPRRSGWRIRHAVVASMAVDGKGQAAFINAARQR